MKKIRFIIAAVIIAILSLTSYIYFKKQPVESIPHRATLVLLENEAIKKEVEM